MKSYCLKSSKDTENIYPKVQSTGNGKAMILSKCAICGNKKKRLIKNQQTKGLVSNLGVRIMLIKVPILSKRYFVLKYKSVE